MAKPVEQWDVDDVVAYLQRLKLDACIPAIQSNRVCGEDLLALTDTELKEELQITRLQARKIKSHLNDGAPGESPAQQQSDAEPQPPAAAPVDVSGTIPHAEAPDLDDRQALRANPGSFHRSAAPKLEATATAAHAAHPPAPTVHVDEATVVKYGEVTALIAQLEAERVTVLLPGVREALSELDKRVSGEERKYNELVTAQEEEQKNTKVREGWYPGKFLLGKGKAEAKKAEAAREAVKETGLKIKACGTVLKSMHSERAALIVQLNTLQLKADQLQQARQVEDGILPQVFAGITGDEKENKLEADVDAVLPKLQQGRQYSTSYGTAYELVVSARKQLEQAQELFESAYGPGRRRESTRASADAARRAQSKQAAELIDAACGALLKARAIIPALPNFKSEKVKALKGLQVGEVVLMVEDAARRKVDKCLRAVGDLMPDVKAAERWLGGWLARVRDDLDATELLYADKKKALDSYRRNLMQKMVEAQVAFASLQAAAPVQAQQQQPAAAAQQQPAPQQQQAVPAAQVAPATAPPTAAVAAVPAPPRPVLPDLL